MNTTAVRNFSTGTISDSNGGIDCFWPRFCNRTNSTRDPGYAVDLRGCKNLAE